ncbi:hypothetical protein CVT25_008246 [Psilocybe cyanescens]|uniref:Uncharacterized protein n=1 Tax=Psilocybe cyanescens TaxID=93625 RepID=A0A409X6V2_PSICY|nr:hypothetical protein CVT25_008246 [Psilocybe cyanescens]
MVDIVTDLVFETGRKKCILWFHVILTNPVQISELNFAILVKKNVGFSQVAKDISLNMQVHQYLFKLGMSVCWLTMRFNIA